MLAIAPQTTRDHVSRAVNSFNPNYHRHYQGFLKHRAAYLGVVEPSDTVCLQAATALIEVLKAWGAGKRKAPVPKSASCIAQMLADEAFHGRVKRLKNFRLDYCIMRPARAFSATQPGHVDVAAFDQDLAGALRRIAAKFFLEPVTSPTYPMKVLLLLTGLMPALDSQVRGGLKNAGMKGFSGLLNLDSPQHMQKICSLPFEMGQLLNDPVQAQVISNGIAGSRRAEAVPDLGRLFDILLFEQNTAPLTLVYV